MATFSETANSMLASLKYDYALSDAQINDIRLQIGRWADVVGITKTKEFQTPNGYTLTVTATNHEVTDIKI
jgi:hypothetical protein